MSLAYHTLIGRRTSANFHFLHAIYRIFFILSIKSINQSASCLFVLSHTKHTTNPNPNPVALGLPLTLLLFPFPSRLTRYFKCSDQHGLFVRPAHVTLVDPAAAPPTSAAVDSSAPDSVETATGVESEELAGDSATATSDNDNDNDNISGMEEDVANADSRVGGCGDTEPALDMVAPLAVGTSANGTIGVETEDFMGGSSASSSSSIIDVENNDDDSNNNTNGVGEDGGDDVEVVRCDDAAG